jgi:hypothetical protein
MVVSNVKDEAESVAKEIRDLGREGIAYVVAERKVMFTQNPNIKIRNSKQILNSN